MASSIELDKETQTGSTDNTTAGSQQPSSNLLRIILWACPRIFAVIFLIVLLVWIFQAEGGLGFDEATVFGWHALFMALFIVVFCQEAVLAFSMSIFSPLKRSPVSKWFHVSFHVLGIICAMIGITAIVYYKNLSSRPVVFPFYAVYSPHSWLGICILVLWALQALVALVSDYIPPGEKSIISKLHKLIGKAIFLGGLATCALGLQDMQSSDLAGSTPLIPGVIDANTMGATGSVVIGNQTITLVGYFPNSPEAQYASGCTILLFFIGIATFGALEFHHSS